MPSLASGGVNAQIYWMCAETRRSHASASIWILVRPSQRHPLYFKVTFDDFCSNQSYRKLRPPLAPTMLLAGRWKRVGGRPPSHTTNPQRPADRSVETGRWKTTIPHHQPVDPSRPLYTTRHTSSGKGRKCMKTWLKVVILDCFSA